MFKRLTWFGLGAAAGASGVMWAQQKVRRQIDALGPDHIVVTAGHQARKVSKQVGRTVAGAVVEGRAAMREREDELLARRDGSDAHAWPTSSARSPQRRSGRPGPSSADRPTRPARW
ncbi:hypothetical protein [Dermatobacter hominis]|uniref:hypothetical protein n=1 Tax=Dermatobacter hominis TaxID=2884263 RepID=UPI001D120BD8|nr:hypothetical protein [Dermatobacter hominis]UDY36177.1 hypothetical protein LH044_01255 [Dermatobacter hominis]